MTPLPPGYDPSAPIVTTAAVPNCPVCGHDKNQSYASGFDFELETCGNEWIFVRCADCGCVWLNPRPDERELGVIYPASYYSYNLEQRISPLAVKGKAMLDRMKFKGILAALQGSPKSYLDIGCGDGRYLRMFAERGLSKERIFGLELSQAAVDTLEGQGFQAHCRRVEDCDQIPPGGIELATMFHVIEHVADPGAVIEKIATWLSPGGLVAIETPNLSALDARLFRSKWWGGYHIPRHWTLFDEDSLSRLVRDAGLEVAAIHYQTGHSFWMYSFHHLLRYNRRAPLAGLSKLFDPMRGLPMLIAFTGLDTLRRLIGLRTSAVLLLARKPRA